MSSTDTQPTSFRNQPDSRGYFGDFGGVFVPETLSAALHELSRVYAEAKADNAFWNELSELNRTFVGRPTPLYQAARLTELARQQAGAGMGATI